MRVTFPEAGFSQRERDEIDDILYRICTGDGPGEWRSQPDEICVLKRLSGGRSGSQVLEVLAQRGNSKARKVIKLGPGYDLVDEFTAFNTHLRNASASIQIME